MAFPIPLLLIGAAFLLMGKKGNGAPQANGHGASGNGNGEAEAFDPEKVYEEGEETAEGWVAVAKVGDAPQKFIKPPVEMTLLIPGQTPPPPTPPPPPPPPPAPGSDVPAGAHCADVANWDAAWVAKELEMLAEVNAIRAQGFSCPGTQQAPVPPLVMNPSLRCAARKHSKDMAEKGYFSHTNTQGEESWDRMMAAGYNGTGFSENIAAGSSQIEHTMNQWLTSTEGHCEALFDPDMKEIGIGYYPTGTGHKFYWTQNFGKY